MEFSGTLQLHADDTALLDEARSSDMSPRSVGYAEYPMRVLHFLSLPFYPFRTVRDNTPYGEKLIADAQRRVDEAKTRPPDDRDDAHPGAHPYSATFRRINPGMAGHRAPGYAEL